MKIHSSVTDATGAIQQWIFDFELVYSNEQNLFLIEKFMYNWWWLSIPYALLYIIAIFIGQSWMVKKKQKI
jgi:hypothetical protein